MSIIGSDLYAGDMYGQKLHCTKQHSVVIRLVFLQTFISTTPPPSNNFLRDITNSIRSTYQLIHTYLPNILPNNDTPYFELALYSSIFEGNMGSWGKCIIQPSDFFHAEKDILSNYSGQPSVILQFVSDTAIEDSAPAREY